MPPPPRWPSTPTVRRARELELGNLAVVEATAPPLAAAPLPLGFGLAGDLPAPLSLAQITSALARHIDLSTATVCGPVPESISRLAYCTGSGSSLLREARAAGAQLFITGDVKYHTALEAEICLLDVGHHSLEEEMMRRMSGLLAQRLSGLNVVFVPSVSPLRPVLLP